jgi:hypothetical protein
MMVILGVSGQKMGGAGALFNTWNYAERAGTGLRCAQVMAERAGDGQVGGFKCALLRVREPEVDVRM